MSDFFEARLSGYDEHMLKNIDGAEDFYPFTAGLLPLTENASVLDLGCGTGIELEYYFRINPTASVTGIDLSSGMLGELSHKLFGKKLTLICGSYFDTPLGESAFDAAVSVESLHHFTREEKIPLYKRLKESLKDGGYFILTDYFALSDEEEKRFYADYKKLLAQEKAPGTEIYHYDTPLTVENEISALISAGFSSVNVLNSWGATHTIKATKNKQDF